MKTEIPTFDSKAAKSVASYRHEATGRTVSFHQEADSNVHLFSATFVFIATVKKEDGDKLAADSAAETKARHAAEEKAAKDAAAAALKRTAEATAPADATAPSDATTDATAPADALPENAPPLPANPASNDQPSNS